MSISNTPIGTPIPLRKLWHEFITRGNDFERQGNKLRAHDDEPSVGDCEMTAAATYHECARLLQEALRAEKK